MTIQESLYLYKTQKRALGISEDTIQRVIVNVMMFCNDMDVKRISTISTEKVLAWGEQKRAKGIKSSTMATYFNSMRAYVTFLNSQSVQCGVDPARVRCKAKYKRRRALRPREIKKIISYADPQTAVLIRLLYMTGLRIAEAVSITGEHLAEGTTIYINGKGDKERPVFVDADLAHTLSVFARMNGGAVFVDSMGVQLSRKKAYYYVKKAAENAGLPKASPHIFRHSFATELLRNGASLSHTSRLMGHSSVSVTEIYTHLLTDDIKKAHSKYLVRI